MIPNIAKTLAVIVCSTIFATLAVNAVDMRGHYASSFLGAIFFTATEEEVEICPDNMVLVTQALMPFCVDLYEASPAESCVYVNPSSEEETKFNLADPACRAESKPRAEPWRFVTKGQAVAACLDAGKRLPTASEWFKAAIGTNDMVSGLTEEHCNLARNRADGAGTTGGGMRCVSDVGAYDMVGNVWEWVDGVVDMGVWQGQEIAQTGYVQGVDVAGISLETGSLHDERFAHDRFWSDSTISAGMMRGGYYDSKSDGGVYATYAASPESFSGNAAGFRCVTDAIQL